MTANKHKQKPPIQINDISIRELLNAMLSKWYLFIICLLLTVGHSLQQTAKTPSTYTRSTKVLIKSTKKGNSMDEQIETFANMGFRSSTNAYNEIYTFRAPETTIETARRLRLNIEYTQKGKYHPTTLYGKDVPVFVEFSDLEEHEAAGFELKINPDSTYLLSRFTGKVIAQQRPIEGKLSSDSLTFIGTPVGTIALSINPRHKLLKSTTYSISHINIASAAGKYVGRLNYSLDESDNNLITITTSDQSIERADDILRTVVEVYNENWVKDRNKSARETKQFINERLDYVSQELDKIESNISDFKSDNLLHDIDRQYEIQLRKERELEKQHQSATRELEKSDYLLRTIRETADSHALLPINPGISNTNIIAQISGFNTLMIERNNLASKSSEDNPAVNDMNITLSSMRSAIISSLNTHIKSITTRITSLERERATLQSNIAQNPKHSTFLVSSEREQSVKESIYMFLLQKYEENLLSQEHTPNRTRVLSPPSGSYNPTAPQGTRSLILSIIIGILIPAVLICVIEVTNTKVRGRNDLNHLTTPIIGEIPQHDTRRARRIRRIFSNLPWLKKKKTDRKAACLVKEGSRDAINEAFRVLRTNIEFIGRDKKQNTILFTSFNPGSGKTFCILNTAVSLALKGDKVLLIDGDMRHASLSEYVDSCDTGLSNYLAGEAETLNDIIVVDKAYESLHIIPTGTVPPNPTELLESERLRTLLDTAKEQYKYILIDCPPIDIVADTHIIEKYATNTFFLVRCNLLERSMLVDIDNLYNEDKLCNLSVILNGIDMKSGKYGYKYGYNSGGRYNYGQYSTKKRKKKK